MASIKLRAAAESDREKILAILRDAGLPTEDLTEDISWLRLGFVDRRLVAIGGVQPAGQYGLLRSIVTVPEARGRGNGLPFVEALVEQAHHDHLVALYLLTDTAEGFFAKLGFEKTDRDTAPTEIKQTAEFARICPEGATCMRRIF